MLKFLTHKLRTHSLNEDHVSEKVDGRDSGTESDDEVDVEREDVDEFCADAIMKWNDITDISMASRASSTSPAESAREASLGAPPPLSRRLSPPRADPDHMYDHHSSEEELEVINGAPSESFGGGGGGEAARRAGAPAAPEKRKWTAAENDENATRAASSSDDDTKVETPVRFRTSPPLEALKPRRGRGRPLSPLTLHNACGCRAEPPHKLAHLAGPAVAAAVAAAAAGAQHDASPRKRTRHAPRRHRPCLDFDKMQQLKVRGVTSWRHHGAGGTHGGGELSVFCW